MYKLYGAAASRTFRCIWTFCELNVDFEHIHLSFTNRDTKSRSFLEKNPMGKVPLLEYNGQFLFESGAICSFIAQKNRQKTDLIGAEGSLFRANVEKWLFFTLSEFEQPLWNIRKHTMIYPLELRCENIIKSANLDFSRALSALKNSIKDLYIVNNTFSLADIFIAQTLFWANEVKAIESDLTYFDDYLKRLKEREGFPRIKDYLP